MNELIHVGIGTYIGDGVTVFPVWPEGPTFRGSAWGHEHLSVQELPAGARVDTLHVTNNGPWPVVIVEGDIFEGGLQNRTAARTIMIAPRDSAELPVLCIEQGRWDGEQKHQSRTHIRRSPFATRRGMFSAQAQKSDAQGRVWDEISNLQHTRGYEDGSSLAASMDRIVGAPRRLDRETGVTILPGQRGVMIGIGGEIAGCEIFGSERGLKVRLQAIVDSARYEALDLPANPTPNYKARAFARAMMESQLVGKDLREPIIVASKVGELAITSTIMPSLEFLDVTDPRPIIHAAALAHSFAKAM